MRSFSGSELCVCQGWFTVRLFKRDVCVTALAIIPHQRTARGGHGLELTQTV